MRNIKNDVDLEWNVFVHNINAKQLLKFLLESDAE